LLHDLYQDYNIARSTELSQIESNIFAHPRHYFWMMIGIPSGTGNTRAR